MAYIFGDGFDCYATIADAAAGYWDSGNGNGTMTSPGRFTGSQALRSSSTGAYLVKSSGVNEAVHHFVCAVRQTTAITGSSLGLYLQLLDGVTGQCCVVFRSDGAIVLTSATPVGTVLATYTGAFTVTNTWYAFEIEVFISPTAGFMNVRKNGNTVNDFTSATNLVTRPGANSYANKLQLGSQVSVGQDIDDLLWRSDVSSVPWLGDIRCYTRMPASDASVQFAKSLSTLTITPVAAASSTTLSNGVARYTAFTATYDGTISTATVALFTGYTGNMKCSIFASSGTAPTTILGSATTITNPITGVNTFTFGTPVVVTRGTQYWIGFVSDTTSGLWSTGSASNGVQSSTAYAAFPVASPTPSSVGSVIVTLTLTVGSNTTLVNEAQQDGASSYVYDSTAGHADFYNIAALGSTPSSVIAVTVRGFMEKSDAGTRTGNVQLRSGSAVTPIAWDAATATAVTLSGGNLVATNTGTTSADQGVHVAAPNAQSGGKYYFEVTWTTVTGGGNAGVGIGTTTSTYTNMGNGGTTGVHAYRGGSIYSNGSNTGVASGTVMAAGTTMCIAVDLDNHTVWFRQGASGNWNSNATYNPTTNVGGVTIPAGAMVPFVTFGGSAGASGNVVTANFGASTFVGVVPSGFTGSWGTPIIGTVVVSPTNNLSTSWGWVWRTDLTDPATGSAWTPAAVNNVTIGPSVVA